MSELVTQPNQPQTVAGWLEQHEDKFQAVLPKGLPVERFMRTVATAVTHNPSLKNADKQSFFLSAMTAACLGLELDPSIGQAYLVPFKGKVQCVPGYKGYIKLAEISGYIVQGFVVREKDVFEYELGLEPKLRHVPAPGSSEARGNIVYAYATARHAKNPPIFRVVDIEYIKKIQSRSSGYKAYMAGKIKETPWANDFEAMASKTAVRALAPQLPLNVQRAHALESAWDTGETAYITDPNEGVVVQQAQQSGATAEQPKMGDIIDA